MKNKTVYLSTTSLNSGNVIVVDSWMSLYQTTSNGIVSGTVYPKEIQIINDTGANLEYNFMANDDEYNDYLSDATNYSLVYLPNGSTLEDEDVLNRCKRLLIKVDNGTATDQLRIDFINYSGYEIRWV